ncbi:glycolate oxidase [Teratosphaeria destructans]|uniref:Glycolate oxidase n=1 Tax=Teratosphaeria destructans TaxID=418781 RepID=A0A9W7W846_9PEZI|nr:glycolate oxidase [Teratosphaeria destructans]
MPLHTYSAALEGRENLLTATVTTKITHTGVNCLSTGLINCPASLQNTSLSRATTTFVTIIPSGAELGHISPLGIQNAVVDTATSRLTAVKMTASSGSPTSYLPPQTTSNKAGSTPGAIGLALSGKVGGVSKKLILGLSSGLGVTVSLAIIAAIM